jgi:hypothetical protein
MQGGIMSMAVATHQTSDFVIQGPVLARGNKVLEAIHALYYLPENFKLVFAGNKQVDQSFYKEVVSLVERDQLNDRVDFSDSAEPSSAVIVSENKRLATKNTVSGDSPEALASAILNVARRRD